MLLFKWKKQVVHGACFGIDLPLASNFKFSQTGFYFAFVICNQNIICAIKNVIHTITFFSLLPIVISMMLK